MAVYSVFEPPQRGNDAADHAERFAFMRDAFSWAAFVFGPLWMLWHRLWLVLLGYLVIVATFAVGLHLIGTRSDIGTWAGLLFALLIGLEAASLRRWTLLHAGWKDRGIVIADDLEGAERRFFTGWTPAVPSSPQQRPPAARLRPAGNEVVGLFPQPGANR